ncbi:MAG: hypothetical protein Q7S30_04580 [Candidatus Omnitrophota bacterium]|nr:hypothetical protein [Candidatus Omnitrophota bacterium]
MTIKNKGYTLTYVILAMVLSAALASSLYTTVFLHNRLFTQLQYNKLAFYKACSGTEYALYIIRSGHYADPTNTGSWPPVPAGATVQITTSGAVPPLYTIISTGTDSGVQKTITVTEQSGETISWQVS